MFWHKMSLQKTKSTKHFDLKTRVIATSPHNQRIISHSSHQSNTFNAKAQGRQEKTQTRQMMTTDPAAENEHPGLFRIK